eukprot:TRINITY_DN1573_c0_g2_i1.p1 TRINITY_DN1573_c0_g2~~TRINITY_DN1573_c0_g2_i1.p1  ORF type:complete len:217 (+),score=52.63 TRINITY_DN1573_c0_g2_i1:109-759(+)
MEFSFRLGPIFHGENVTAWSPQSVRQLPATQVQQFQEIVDELGKESAKAQGYSVITSFSKFMASQHHLYLYCEDTTVVGLLKVGHVHLFIYDDSGGIHEIEPLCVLDFYVHSTQQRSGIGKRLFDFMLQNEQVSAWQLGYDRPSPKLIGFLNKHFSLSQYTPQANKFVVFKQFFLNQSKQERSRKPNYSSFATAIPTSSFSSSSSFSSFSALCLCC